MSGSPPPEPPAEPPQTAGRRRKRSRSHTPTTTTTAAAAAASPITLLDTTAPRPSTLPRGGETIAEPVVQPGPYALNYPLPPASYQSASSLPPTSISAPSPRLALSPLSPRATRKPKAHVASACVNCKKKHLRCDSSRPCRRCVQNGKEDSCVDVEHKKRGRPPLKPDDASARRPGFEAALSPVPSRLGEPRRFADQSIFPPAAAYHPIRPLGTTNFRPGRAASSIFTLHAPPSISPSLATAEGTFVPSSSRQYPAGIAPMPGHAPAPYNPSHPESAFPSMTYAGGYNYPSQQGQVGTSGYYTSNPIFPPRPSSLPADQLPPLQTQTPSSLQLPPILPAPSAPIDPAIVQQLPQQTQPFSRGEQGSRNDGTQEPDPKRPKMDIQGILGPRND